MPNVQNSAKKTTNNTQIPMSNTQILTNTIQIPTNTTQATTSTGAQVNLAYQFELNAAIDSSLRNIYNCLSKQTGWTKDSLVNWKKGNKNASIILTNEFNKICP